MLIGYARVSMTGYKLEFEIEKFCIVGCACIKNIPDMNAKSLDEPNSGHFAVL